MTEMPREDWQAIATRAMATLDTVRAYVEPYHLATLAPTVGDVVPDDYQRGILHACDHVYQLATADPAPGEPEAAANADADNTWTGTCPTEEHQCWRPGDIVRDANNDLYWRSWDNNTWSFLLRRPGRWTYTSACGPIRPPLELIATGEQ